MRELHPGAEFHFSPGWFDRFKVQNQILYHRAASVAQQKTADHEKIRTFHQEV
jgi:hypothetical protein